MKFLKYLATIKFISKISQWLRPRSTTDEPRSTPPSNRSIFLHRRKLVKIGGVFDRHQQAKNREIRQSWKWIQRIIAGVAALVFALIPTIASANILVATPSVAVTATILTTLTGANVTLSSLVVKQGPTQIATGTSVSTFSTGTTGTPNIGIDTGVALVTGAATTAIGPNNSPGTSTGSGIQILPDDPEIALVTGSSTGNATNKEFDVTSITFNVVPQGNFLAIKYVFASEEYNEYVCSQFNDAMGVFIKPVGGTYTNIAKVNGSDLTINQINIGTAGTNGNVGGCNLSNAAFFVNNPANSANLQYDGFTKPVESQYAVIPGNTYTIKIAVADIGDNGYDSAVFVNKISSFSLDFGDAPESYVTAPTNGGIWLTDPARHSTGTDLYLGSIAPDAENTVTPATAGNPANNDDTTGTGTGADDEDAFGGNDLFILSGVTSYTMPNIPVHNTVGTAKLMGWIDFNKNGTFDATELATASVPSGAITATLSWPSITTPAAGLTSYARFRITTDPAFTTTASPIGLAINGEVEDYRVKFDTRANIGAKVILVKRITAIKQAGSSTWSRIKNPNEPAATATVLNTVVANPAEPTNLNYLNPNWPTPSYVVGAANAGKILPGDELEYTIYYLNSKNAPATSLKICDPIRGGQTYTPNSMQLFPGSSSAAFGLSDATLTTVDRANSYTTSPLDCNIGGVGYNVSAAARNTNGGVAVQLVGNGASTQPDLSAIPGATAPATPTTSYGWFRFTTKVD
jgi:GEVED domain